MKQLKFKEMIFLYYSLRPAKILKLKEGKFNRLYHEKYHFHLLSVTYNVRMLSLYFEVL